MSREHIQIGDIVHVDFNNAQYTLCKSAEVLNIPCNTGDSWIFRRIEDDAIFYVSEGITVKLLEKGKNHEQHDNIR